QHRNTLATRGTRQPRPLIRGTLIRLAVERLPRRSAPWTARSGSPASPNGTCLVSRFSEKGRPSLRLWTDVSGGRCGRGDLPLHGGGGATGAIPLTRDWREERRRRARKQHRSGTINCDPKGEGIGAGGRWDRQPDVHRDAPAWS